MARPDGLDDDVLSQMLEDGLLELAAIGPEGEILARVSQKGREMLERQCCLDELVDLGYLEPTHVDGELAYRLTGKQEEDEGRLRDWQEFCRLNTPEMLRERIARREIERFRAPRTSDAKRSLGLSGAHVGLQIEDDQTLYFLQRESGTVAFTLVEQGSSKTMELGFTSLELAREFAKKGTSQDGPQRVVRIVGFPARAYLEKARHDVALDVDPFLLKDLHEKGIEAGSQARFTVVSPMRPAP